MLFGSTTDRRDFTASVESDVITKILLLFMEGQYASKSPLVRSARRRRTASAPFRLQRAPVRSIRSWTRYRHAPSMTPVAIGNPIFRYWSYCMFFLYLSK